MSLHVAVEKLVWSVGVVCLALVCSCAALGQDQTVTKAPVGETTAYEQGVHDYVISADDVLDVYVMDVAELSRSYRVSATGKVNLPLLSEPVVAAGLTLTEFSEVVAGRLKGAGLINEPHVTTSIQQSRLHSVSITGAVRSPQIYSVLGRTTLLDVLSQAGGITEDAGNTVIIHRGTISPSSAFVGREPSGVNGGSEDSTLVVDLQKLLEGGDPKLNVEVYPGDRLLVQHGGFVYVVGAVNRPGGFAIKAGSKGLTVLQAIALAQDTKSTAKRNKTVLIRKDLQTSAARSEIAVDLRGILAGKTPDLLLQADDILFVPDSAGKKILRRGSEAVLQVATGVALYRSY